MRRPPGRNANAYMDQPFPRTISRALGFCWFDGLYARVVPSQAVELTARGSWIAVSPQRSNISELPAFRPSTSKTSLP
jgi:hypothetical protein